MRAVRSLHPAWGAFLLVLLVRGLVALSRVDEWFGEEIYAGTVAWALLRGMPLDPTRLPVIVHLRGSFVFALLLVPLHAALGPSVLSLRVLAVVWSAATAALLALLVARLVGRGAAWLLALLFALLPPAYQMVDVLALGSHLDWLLPAVGALCVLLWSPGPLGARRAFAFGLLTGATVTFSFHGLVLLPALALVWLVRDPRAPLRKGALATAAGLALGLAPVPLLSRQVTKLVTAPMDSHVLPQGVGGALEKLGWTLSEGLRRALLFEDAVGAWAGWLWVAALAAGLVLLVPRLLRREPLALFVVAYPALLVGAYAVSDFELNLEVRGNGMGSRYLLPMLPFLALGIAVGAADLARRGRRAAAAALALAALVPGACGLAAHLDPAKAWRLPPVRGTAFALWSDTRDHFSYAEPDWRARIELARRVDPDWDAFRPLAYDVLTPRELPPPAAAVARLDLIEPELRPYVLAEVGRRAANAGGAAIAPALAAAEAAGEAGPWLLRGLGSELVIQAAAEFLKTGGRGGVAGRLAALPPAVAEGGGFRLGLAMSPYNERLVALVRTGAELPPAQRDAFYRGLGQGYRMHFLEESWFVPEPGSSGVDAAVPEAGQAAFRAGLAAPRDRFGMS